ncbi:hypothetical protein C8039_05660 [Halogeometricum sp. wsp3]|nr:hypothetical protein C8039_05660 [Halogeometricum sp. wsp3]
MDELTSIPGIGKRTAGDIVINRPYASADEVSVADVDIGASSPASRGSTCTLVSRTRTPRRHRSRLQRSGEVSPDRVASNPCRRRDN